MGRNWKLKGDKLRVSSACESISNVPRLINILGGLDDVFVFSVSDQASDEHLTETQRRK